MDPATIERIVGIVKNMQAGGMTEQQINDNLKSMGVSDDELGSILEKAGIAAPTPVEPEPMPEPIALPHEEHFERLHSNVTELHEKHEELKGSLSEITALRNEIQAVKTEVDEIKPMIGALKRLNENLIEINKKMLARLETK